MLIRESNKGTIERGNKGKLGNESSFKDSITTFARDTDNIKNIINRRYKIFNHKFNFFIVEIARLQPYPVNSKDILFDHIA